MPYYVLEYETNKDGERHIHIENEECYRLPGKENRLALGFHENCYLALKKANKLYDNVNACFNCCMDCYEAPAKLQNQL